ncbi:MAG: glycosyltransferase [Streptococcus sp.]|nr:glycosyltransferase [Streptococcus sp.]
MKKIKIDVIAVPLSGHLYPIMDLVAPLLEDDQYEIRLFTGANKIEIAQAVGFRTVTIFPNDRNKIENVANASGKLTMVSTYQQLSNGIDLTNEFSDALLVEWEKNRPDLVIADFITLSAGLVCEQLQIPWITSMATQFAIESTDGPPCFFGGWDNSRPILNACGRKLTRLIKRMIFFSLRKKLERYNFKVYNQKNEETIYSPYSILSLGMKEVELKSGFPQHYIWAGPCCSSFEKEEEFPFALDKIQKKKVLVSCGTQIPWSKGHLIDIAKELGCVYSDYHFIVTLGNSKGNKLEQKNVAENVTVVPYLPYNYYIPKMDYVIHHGGAGIFYNCIKYGKPALILPHDYDQADYAIRGKVAQISYRASRNNMAQIIKEFGKMIERSDWTALEELQSQFPMYRPSETLKSEIKRILGNF